MLDPGLIILFSCNFIFSMVMTGMVRRYSLHKSLIDIPNERSSHNTPTPRGGGMAIVISVLISLGVMFYAQWITLNVFLALVSGGIIVAVTGWLDDHRHVSPLFRGLLYAAAVIITLFFLGGLSVLNLGGYSFTLPLLTNILAVIGMVWLINLYNFMDETDALAAVQTICAGLFLGFLFLLSHQTGQAGLSFLIIASCAGFLYWNWPPARIFMGDVGSCFIGFYFGTLAIIGETTDSVSILVFFILLGVFICDATLTLLLRIIKKDVWYKAHRSHAYQRLVQMGFSHKQIAVGLIAVNVTLLWPMAYVVYHWEQLTIFMLMLAMFLLSLFWAGIQIRFMYYSKEAQNKSSRA